MWEKVKLGEICKLTTGKTPPTKKEEYFGNDLMWLSPGDFKDKYIQVTERGVTNLAKSDKKINLIPANSLFITCIGNIGKLTINKVEACSNQQITALCPIIGNIKIEYLYYYLSTTQKYLTSIANNAVVPIINNGTMKELEIPLPPLHIQEKIAEILDKADELRRKDQELQAKYDQLAQAIFIDMFGDPVKNEKGWEVKRLEEVVSFKTGPFGSLLHKEDYIENGVPVINPTHIIDSKIQSDFNFSVSNEKFLELKAYTVKHNDILIGRRGEMGRCGIVNESMLPMLCGTGCFIISNTEKVLKSSYLHKVMISDSVKEYLNHEAIGVTMKNLNTKILKNLIISIPPIHLQEEFAKKIEIINQLKAQTNAVKSEELFQSLLQKAFKGELVS